MGNWTDVEPLSESWPHIPEDFYDLDRSAQKNWIIANLYSRIPIAEGKDTPEEWGEHVLVVALKMRDYIVLQRDYPDWVPGNVLIVKSQLSEETFRAVALRELPAFRSPHNCEAPVNYIIPPEVCRIARPDLDSLVYPMNWWFRVADAAFFEVIHPELCGQTLGDYYRTPVRVAADWKVPMEKLVKLVVDHGLPVFRLHPQDGVIQATLEFVRDYGLDRCLFVGAGIDAFEARDPDLCGLRKPLPCQEARLAARRYARFRWEEDPSLSVEAIAREIKLMTFANDYQGKNTVSDWIRDLHPRHRKGSATTMDV